MNTSRSLSITEGESPEQSVLSAKVGRSTSDGDILLTLEWRGFTSSLKESSVLRFEQEWKTFSSQILRSIYDLSSNETTGPRGHDESGTPGGQKGMGVSAQSISYPILGSLKGQIHY